MAYEFIITIFASQLVLIVVLIGVILQLKKHIISLEAKIYGQQVSLHRLQKNIDDINTFLNINTTKRRDLGN